MNVNISCFMLGWSSWPVSHLSGVGVITCHHRGWITLWLLWCEAPVYCCVDRGKLWAHNVYYDWNNNSSYRKSKYSFDMQSLRELWSESFCLSLQKYESERLLDPTGGSPDVVHLIKYVSLVLGWLHKAYTVSEANEIDFQNTQIFMFVFLYWGGWNL